MSRHGSTLRFAAAFLALGATIDAATAQSNSVVLTTTTSVRDAGLLDALLDPFTERTGLEVRVVAVGSGQAMELGRRGEADILILHAPEAERRFVTEGFGIERLPLMRNQFVLVGPPDDEARIRGRTAAEALRLIAARPAAFASRGDGSGTHAREMELWALAGVTPPPTYRETGQGMGATLVIADQIRAYTLSDIGTFLAHKAPLDLEVLVDGDSVLTNPYHVILASPRHFRHVNAAAARRLRDYLLSEDAQEIIGSFRTAEFGRPLFVPARQLPRE